MYACAEFCVLTNVSNKYVFGRFPLRGGSAAPPLRAPLLVFENVSSAGLIVLKRMTLWIQPFDLVLTKCFNATRCLPDSNDPVLLFHYSIRFNQAIRLL